MKVDAKKIDDDIGDAYEIQETIKFQNPRIQVFISMFFTANAIFSDAMISLLLS